MGRPRILQLSNRNLAYGGEEAVLGRISDALADSCILFPFETHSGSLLENRLTLPLRVLSNPLVRRNLLALQRSGSFDAWQAHTLLPGMSAAPYETAFQIGVPLIQFLHNYRFSCSNGFFLAHGDSCRRCMGGNFLPALQTGCWRQSRLASGWMGLVLRHLRSIGIFEKVTRWVAPSQAVRTLHIQMGVPPGRIDVVPHFLEPGGAGPPPFPGQPTALFLGRLSPEKGVLRLLEAWRLLDRRDARLLIAGDGPERPALEAFVRESRLDQVRFLGFVPTASRAALWEQASFTVVPSIWEEPFGLVVLESWEHGRPVVAHRIGALPELIVPGTGLLAEPGSARDLAAQLETALAGTRALEAMGQAGRTRLLSDFNKGLWKERMREMYRRAGIAVS